MPRLLYIGQTPAEGTGSPVIVLRHLQRLAAAGWQISVIAESGQDVTACRNAGWEIQTLPLRRAWWPPLRDGMTLLRSIRTWLLAGECQRLQGATPPDAVFGYLAAHADFYPEIAARYARRCGLPLSLLVHDDAAAFAGSEHRRTRLRRRHAWIMRQARRCWFVSPELAALYALPGIEARVLPPIPAGWPHFAGWQEAFARRPRVYYAGSLWAAQLPLMIKIAHTLADAGSSLVLIVRESPELAQLIGHLPITCIPPFPSNAAALAHLSVHAAGLLVAYAETVEQMPWIATSFPSKLVEYAQLGLPCAIVAPRDSAVGRWARQKKYADFFAPNQLTSLRDWARALSNESAWRRRSDQPRQLAAGEFSPEKIQADFAAGLLAP